MNDSLGFDEIVHSLYEALLKRAPDPVGLQSYSKELRSGVTLTEVLESVLRSEEYATRVSPASIQSFPLDGAPPLSIQTTLSSTQQQALWDHVKDVWSRHGRTDAFWSVLSDERWRSSKMRDKQAVERFYQTGTGDVARLDAWLQRNGLNIPADAVCAEYGCGVGRITHALARRFGRVVAFDISQPHLDAAQDQLSGQGIQNTEYVLVRNEADLHRLSEVDVFYSAIVLQHNPPPIIGDILTRAFKGLNPGGVAFFQVPTYSRNYSFSVAQYWADLAQKKTTEMHCFPQKLVLELARRHHVFPIEILQDGYVGQPNEWISSTFLMQKSG